MRHPFPPFFDCDSRILVLGSFPSVKSREQGFFYGHKQNRFWCVTAAVFRDDVPDTLQQKKQFLTKHHIALWDVIASCEIIGSSDATITDAIRHLEHAIDIMGIEHVGLGTDFDGDGGIPGLADASELVNFTKALLRRRYS